MLVVVIASFLHDRFHVTKKLFYSGLVSVIIATTLALLATHVVQIGSSKGSISRYEARLFLVACGQQIPFVPDSMFSRTAGSARFSIDASGRVVYQGYETDEEYDTSLTSFFNEVGGSISPNVLTLPYSMNTRGGIADSTRIEQFLRQNPGGGNYLEFRSGDACDTAPSMVSVYIYRYDPISKLYNQQRISQLSEYRLSGSNPDHQDCVVVMFDQPSIRTTFTCGGFPSEEML
jgi:hypothetical protein